MRLQLLLSAVLALATIPAAGPAGAASRHHRHARSVERVVRVGYAPVPVGYAPVPFEPGRGAALGALPLVGTPLSSIVGPFTGGGFAAMQGPGRPVPPEAARFMGYPYNVPGYRYAGTDGCLLRVGGVFGPGPSAGPCPFGLDRAF